jgi:hypothetical protein
MDDNDVGEEHPLVIQLGERMDATKKPLNKDADTKKPLNKDENDSLSTLQRVKQKLYSQTVDCITASVVVTVVCGGCILSYMFCPPCLFGLLVFSACMCPWKPYFNIPLWVSIILLTLLGWHFTTGNLTLAWH